MKIKFMKLEFLLTGLIALLFVGGFFFVVYEPEIAPSQPLAENIKQNSSTTHKSTVLTPINQKTEISNDKTLKTEPEEKKLPEKLERVVDTVSATADFGVEGTVFSHSSGLSLN